MKISHIFYWSFLIFIKTFIIKCMVKNWPIDIRIWCPLSEKHNSEKQNRPQIHILTLFRWFISRSNVFRLFFVRLFFFSLIFCSVIFFRLFFVRLYFFSLIFVRLFFFAYFLFIYFFFAYFSFAYFSFACFLFAYFFSLIYISLKWLSLICTHTPLQRKTNFFFLGPALWRSLIQICTHGKDERHFLRKERKKIVLFFCFKPQMSGIFNQR